MTPTRIPARVAILMLALTASASLAAAGGGKAIDPNHLAITDCPDEPGCAALVLLDETELSNASARARLSRRRLVKVFTEAGAVDHADVEVLETLGYDECKNLSGRTVLPNGRVLQLKQENIFVKPAYRKGKHRFRVKAAKFPGVVPGALIEVSYDLIDPRASHYSEWVWRIQDTVPILKARLTLRPGGVPFNWHAEGLEKARIVHTRPYTHEEHFEAENIPSLPEEPFPPPVEELRTRLYLFTPSNQLVWIGKFAGLIARQSGLFLDKNTGIPEKVKEILSADDEPVEQVRRIYDFVQRDVGNEQERLNRTHRGDVVDAENVGDVLKRGFGNEFEKTMLFLAMVREAGLPHGVLAMVDRRNTLLHTEAPDENQFEAFGAAVKTDAGWTFYDPAVEHCPFGKISWYKEGGLPNAILVTPEKPESVTPYSTVEVKRRFLSGTAPYSLSVIPFSKAADNVLLREVAVKLAADGSAQVDVSEQAKGQVDLDRRQEYGGRTAEEQRAALVEKIRMTIPDAQLLSASFEGLDDFEGTPTIHYQLVIHSLGIIARNQMVLAPSLFGAPASNPFTAQARRTPVHFPHTQKTVDRISFEIPAGYTLGALPAASIVREGPFVLVTGIENAGDKLVFSRRMEIDVALWPLEGYPLLRSFFEKAQQADRAVVTLARDSPP